MERVSDDFSKSNCPIYRVHFNLYPARFVKIAQNIEISRNPSKIKSSRMFSESPENGCGGGT